jgi:hypothetical protein
MDPARERRREAWAAMSDLFVDTTHDDQALAYIARRLKGTGFSEAELDAMFYGEVDPVLGGHRFVAVGAWPAFDIDWLEGEIEKRRYRSWLGRVVGKLHRVHSFDDKLWHRVMAHWRTA